MCVCSLDRCNNNLFCTSHKQHEGATIFTLVLKLCSSNLCEGLGSNILGLRSLKDWVWFGLGSALFGMGPQVKCLSMSSLKKREESVNQGNVMQTYVCHTMSCLQERQKNAAHIQPVAQTLTQQHWL